MKPCEQFGPVRAREIQELIAAATGQPHKETCDQCPIASNTEQRHEATVVDLFRTPTTPGGAIATQTAGLALSLVAPKLAAVAALF